MSETAETPRVVRNDWSGLTVPELGSWRPTRSVSVIIPAFDCQESLDLTLAALRSQTYPAELTEVVVVDDGSRPALRLPEVRPANTLLLRVPDSGGWGRANALKFGAEHSSGEVIHWLDADMVVFPEHVEAQLRWHHQIPYAVTLGWKRFVDVRPGAPGWPSVESVVAAAADGTMDRLFTEAESEPHEYVEKVIRRSDNLRAGDHTSFMAHVGATATVGRALYLASGGMDPSLRLGEDTELGYRLMQAGAVLIPEPAARSWHLGRTHMMRHEALLQRYNRPFLADRMPYPRWLRGVGGSAWSVPLVTAVVEVGAHQLEPVRATVDSLLASTETDLRVCLVGDWDRLTDGRMRVLDDPDLDLRLIAETYKSDPRVRLVGASPSSVLPSPFQLTAPATCGFAREAVGRLVQAADGQRVGLVRVSPSGVGDEDVKLWRTAAVERARLVRRADESLEDAVAAVHGELRLPADVVGVIDLTGTPPEGLAAGIGATTPVSGGRWLPTTVEVAGLRSWARATVVVARLTARRLRPGARRWGS